MFSGVTKLVKPVYADRPLDSGTNVKQTENYDPKTGTWTANPASANKSLPLYPRLHLLPDGKTYYDAGGQTFNPFGQSYDEALWSFASVYDPKTQRWTDKGLPSVAGLPQGFRGSGFSAMLPLEPGPDGKYAQAQFLSAGGVLGVSPGTYLATNSTTLNSIDTAHNDKLDSKTIGNLNEPRWYGTGTVLPTGQVFLSGGANRDEVVLPGTGNPVLQNEMWDPKTQHWTQLVPADRRPDLPQHGDAAAQRRGAHRWARPDRDRVLLPDRRSAPSCSGSRGPRPTRPSRSTSRPICSGGSARRSPASTRSRRRTR